MSGNTKDKIAVRNNADKITPAATALMANTYANAVVLEKIENLVATCRHRKRTKTSSRFLHRNRKGNNKIYQNSQNLYHYRVGEISAHKSLSKRRFPRTFRKNKILFSSRRRKNLRSLAEKGSTANRVRNSPLNVFQNNFRKILLRNHFDFPKSRKKSRLLAEIEERQIELPIPHCCISFE